MPARCANPVAIQGRSGRLYPEVSLLQFGVFVVAGIDCRYHPEGRLLPRRISPDFWRVPTERVCFPCSPGRARGPGANAPSIKVGSGPGDFSSLVTQVARRFRRETRGIFLAAATGFCSGRLQAGGSFVSEFRHSRRRALPLSS